MYLGIKMFFPAIYIIGIFIATVYICVYVIFSYRGFFLIMSYLGLQKNNKNLRVCLIHRENLKGENIMVSKIKVGVVQQGPILDNDRGKLIERITNLLNEAGMKNVNIITLCETALGPFFPPKLTQEYEHNFISISDQIIHPIIQAARDHNMVIILPFAEKDWNYYYNSAAVIDADGTILGKYRKIHIPAILPSDLPGGTGSYEKLYFTPGNLGHPVFETRYGKIGIQICYDRKYPEGSRILAIKGAQMIFMPVAAATYGEESYRSDTWDLPIRCRAYENGVFVIAANRAGNENGRNHMGRSMIVSPIGAKVLVEGSSNNEELVITDIDLDDVQSAQKSLPWWRDRRPSKYMELVR